MCQPHAAVAGEPGPGLTGLAALPAPPADAGSAGEPGGQRTTAPGLQRAVRGLRGALLDVCVEQGKSCHSVGQLALGPQPGAHLPADPRAAPGLTPLAQDPGVV